MGTQEKAEASAKLQVQVAVNVRRRFWKRFSVLLRCFFAIVRVLKEGIGAGQIPA